ncbi:MAG: cytochrome c-type biogenesis protein [Pseudomonadota bacterium]
MIRALAAIALALAVLAAAPAGAVLPSEILADEALEARARALSRQIRCQVCQNQSIDDSNAPLAADLRRLVRERLVAGDSDPAVLEFMTRRFGDYVLLNPPMKPATWLLWFGPLLVLALACLGIAVYFRRRRAAEAPAALAPEEERRLAALIGEPDRRSG